MTHDTVTVHGHLYDHAKKTKICSRKQNFLIFVKYCKQLPRTEPLVEIIGDYCILSAGLGQVSLHATNSRTALLDISLFVSRTLILSGGQGPLNKPFRGSCRLNLKGMIQRCLGPKIRPRLWAFWLPCGLKMSTVEVIFQRNSGLV